MNDSRNRHVISKTCALKKVHKLEPGDLLEYTDHGSDLRIVLYFYEPKNPTKCILKTLTSSIILLWVGTRLYEDTVDYQTKRESTFSEFLFEERTIWVLESKLDAARSYRKL